MAEAVDIIVHRTMDKEAMVADIQETQVQHLIVQQEEPEEHKQAEQHLEKAQVQQMVLEVVAVTTAVKMEQTQEPEAVLDT